MKLFLCLFVALQAAAQSPLPFPSLDPDSQAAAFAPGGGGGYTWEDLAVVSLWASRIGAPGGAEEDAGVLVGRIRAAVVECAAGVGHSTGAAGAAGGGPLGEYVLTFMHKKFLKSYSLLQTRVDTLLLNGRYNCVSSAALYLILARAAGLEVRGVMTRDHAFAAVKTGAGNEWIDVETTNPYGFDPGNRKEFHDQFGRVTGFAYVPAKNYRDRAFISPLELVSLILSNRIAALEKAGRFAEAVPLAVNRYALLEGRTGAASSSEFFEDPYRDMMNRIFNYGASLVNGGREEDALRWAAHAGARYPDEERWQEFIMAAVNNRLVKFLRQGDAAGGREFLNANAALLSAANYRRLDALAADAELAARAAGLRGGAGTVLAEAGAILDAIDAAAGKALLDGTRATELRTAVIGKAAEILAGGRSGGAADWPAAIAWLVSALDRYGPNRRLEQTLAECRANHGVEFHNRFAAAWNKRDFDGAKKILAEGLALYPGNRQLLADSKRSAF
jgi:hypothetical protein